jgi:hypothetical protein
MTAIPLTRNHGLGASRTALGTAENALRQRSVRVFAVVIAVAAMSVADLYLTITYLQGVGMNEGNPLARFIMSFNCPWLLGAWKLFLLGTTCSILLVARRTRFAEVAAWLCCAVMIWLTGQWRQYAEKIPSLTPVIHQLADGRSPDWVQFSPNPPAQ